MRQGHCGPGWNTFNGIGGRDYRVLSAIVATVCVAGTAKAQLHSSDRWPVVESKVALKMLLVKPRPEYPAIARVNYLQGRVEVEVNVNSKGEVVGTHVLAGNAVLAASALQAAREWRFTPLATASGPSRFSAIIPLKFSLNLQPMTLSPKQAEKDFMRSVTPPEAKPPLEGNVSGEDTVHLRVLIDDHGQVIDRDQDLAGNAQFDAACQALQKWSFRPAHWGAIAVPSYIDVNIPVSPSAVARAIDLHDPSFHTH